MGQRTEIADLAGWLEDAKADRLTQIIQELDPKLIVEVGVFGGRSLLHMALEAPKALVYGIDPWSVGPCLEGMKNEDNLAWWDNQKMLDTCHAALVGRINFLGIKNVQLMRNTSDGMYDWFKDDSIDIFHSDGNHSADPTMRDIQHFAKKVKVGGYIVQDDYGWTEGGERTVKPAVDWALENGYEWVEEIVGAAFIRRTK